MVRIVRHLWPLTLALSMHACGEPLPVSQADALIPTHDSLLGHVPDTVVADGITLTDTPEEPGPDGASVSEDSVMDSTEDGALDGETSSGAVELAPTFPHFDTVVDLHRGDVPVWAHLVHVDLKDASPTFSEFSYGDTADKPEFWPASTIKIYPAIAALTLLKEQGFSLDAEATFYHHDGNGWVLDTSKTFRDLIFESFNCSSNSAYTLLLRFAGVDWLNQEFFTPEHGFNATTLMVGYVSERPHVYKRSETQKIVVSEGDETWERVHSYGGTPYYEAAGCTVFYAASAANCSSPRDMTEHMRRVMFHEHLPQSQRFDLRLEDLQWMRTDGSVMNNTDACGSHGWAGVKKVFPNANFYHKAGTVSSYRLDLHYVDDIDSDTRYILAVATKSESPVVLGKLSEEIARMVRTPGAYVHLDYLKDGVNPVTSSLVVYSSEPGTLELRVKEFDLPVGQPDAWQTLAGTSSAIQIGTTSHELTSECLNESGKFHVMGQVMTEAHIATSDLHYVVVDAGVPCP